MPNWCQNVAYIKHEDTAELDKIVKELNKGDEAQLFNSLVPNPSGEWQYDWSIENWGCKWDASVYEYSLEPEHLYISFDTAWGPPIEFYNRLGEMGYQVKAFYREEGMAFAGLYEDGDDDYYEYGNMTADEIEEQLPTELDEMFSISQYARDYEEDQRREEALANDPWNDMQRSDWFLFKKYDPPVEGVYEIETEAWPYPNFKYWDGKNWHWYDQVGREVREIDDYVKVKSWRGVTESAKADFELAQTIGEDDE